VFNLGSIEEVTITDLATTVWRLVRSDDPKITFIAYEAFGKYQDVRRRVPALTQSSNVLGFVPKLTIEDGLRRTIAWQRKVLGR
jgi:nucleoside-diphosphate-sugar epimerase